MMNILTLLRYAGLLSEILAALGALSAAGQTGHQTIRGVRYGGGEYEIELNVKRVR